MLLKQFAKNTKTFWWGYIWGMQESMDCIKAKFITTNIFKLERMFHFMWISIFNYLYYKGGWLQSCHLWRRTPR